MFAKASQPQRPARPLPMNNCKPQQTIANHRKLSPIPLIAEHAHWAITEIRARHSVPAAVP